MNSRLALLLAVLVGCGVEVGCNDGGGGNAAAEDSSSSTDVTLNLNGKWTGSASVLGDGDPGTIAITATIKQQGDAIIIRTSLPTIGANLSGTIEPDGEIILTDAFDGEIWTTHFQTATDTHVQIADFVHPPSVEDPEPPTNVIDLVR